MRMILSGLAALVALVAAGTLSNPAIAGGLVGKAPAVVPSAVVKVGGGYYGRYRKRRPQVRSFRRRAGGYSYEPQDTINTYGDSRTLFGGTNSYRDPALDRQTIGGPFDHGWFFDSGTGLNGGNSPYLN